MGKGSSTSLLDKAKAAQAEQREQERQAVLDRLLVLLAEAAGRFELRQAYLLGSIAKPGRFREESDIDVAVVGLPGEHFFPLAAFLHSRLGREVDLVAVEDVHFADKIRREGIEWTRSS